jgi:hypothetical protein
MANLRQSRGVLLRAHLRVLLEGELQQIPEKAARLAISEMFGPSLESTRPARPAARQQHTRIPTVWGVLLRWASTLGVSGNVTISTH